jgi:hypothetical protein
LKEVDSDTLLFQEILKHPNKTKWMAALDGEVDNMKEY